MTTTAHTSTLSLILVLFTCGVLNAEEKEPTVPPLGGPAATPGVLRVQAQPDQLVEVRTRTRHTTVLVLPPGENILDFVVGDSDYWHLSGSANLAYLKPLDEKIQTNVALVCESGAIYSFLVKEAPDPHLVVRIETKAGKAASAARPAFVARSAVDDYREMARAAGEAARAAREAADLRSTRATELRPRKPSPDSRPATPAGCPLPTSSTRRPASGLSWLRPCGMTGNSPISAAVRRNLPHIYELKDGKPSLVAYDLTPEGLYIARHVLGDGWLRIGKKRARWRFTPPRGFALTPPQRIKRLLSDTKRALEGAAPKPSKEEPND